VSVVRTLIRIVFHKRTSVVLLLLVTTVWGVSTCIHACYYGYRYSFGVLGSCFFLNRDYVYSFSFSSGWDIGVSSFNLGLEMPYIEAARISVDENDIVDDPKGNVRDDWIMSMSMPLWCPFAGALLILVANMLRRKGWRRGFPVHVVGAQVHEQG